MFFDVSTELKRLKRLQQWEGDKGMGNSGAVENFMKWMREPGKMNQGGAGRDSCREKKSRGPAGGRDPIDDRK